MFLATITPFARRRSCVLYVSDPRCAHAFSRPLKRSHGQKSTRFTNSLSSHVTVRNDAEAIVLVVLSSFDCNPHLHGFPLSNNERKRRRWCISIDDFFSTSRSRLRLKNKNEVWYTNLHTYILLDSKRTDKSYPQFPCATFSRICRLATTMKILTGRRTRCQQSRQSTKTDAMVQRQGFTH